MTTLNLDDLIEEFGNDVVTTADLLVERAKLQREFLVKYCVHAYEIDDLIRSGELRNGRLVEAWIELTALLRLPLDEDAEHHKRRTRQAERQAESRESGSFAFRIPNTWHPSRLWVTCSCVGRGCRAASSQGEEIDGSGVS